MKTSKIDLKDLSWSEIHWACVAANASDRIESLEAQMLAAGPAGLKLAREVQEAQEELEYASEKCATIWDRMELDVFAIRDANKEWCLKLAKIFAPAFAAE